MTTPATTPDRVRLHNGRRTHAAHPGAQRRFTFCGYPTNKRDHWLPDDEPVTCHACQRAIARTGDAR